MMMIIAVVAIAGVPAGRSDIPAGCKQSAAVTCHVTVSSDATARRRPARGSAAVAAATALLVNMPTDRHIHIYIYGEYIYGEYIYGEYIYGDSCSSPGMLRPGPALADDEEEEFETAADVERKGRAEGGVGGVHVEGSDERHDDRRRDDHSEHVGAHQPAEEPAGGGGGGGIGRGERGSRRGGEES
eukprot:GHVU01209009.1.p1 GENE.GHVU01209009.1~~GHVU01209009.1.p1  ORF type:complete len:186 (+),score=42.62 GHVU01209009.1:473-1030(+)